MIVLRILLVVCALVLAALIIRALGQADMFAAFAAILADPWGLVGLADLYVTLIMLAIVIAGFEGGGRRTLALIVGLFTIGGIVGALWFAWRLPALWAVLSSGRSRPA
jgi:hypothetical protein